MKNILTDFRYDIRSIRKYCLSRRHSLKLDTGEEVKKALDEYDEYFKFIDTIHDSINVGDKLLFWDTYFDLGAYFDIEIVSKNRIFEDKIKCLEYKNSTAPKHLSFKDLYYDYYIPFIYELDGKFHFNKDKLKIKQYCKGFVGHGNHDIDFDLIIK